MTERKLVPRRPPASAPRSPTSKRAQPIKSAGNGRPAVARDRIFSTPKARLADFNFGRETAEVFDDMLLRSVPMYAETQRMVADLVADFAADKSNIYDLGCSTCTSFLDIDRVLPKEREVKFIGLDSSPEMLQRGREKLKASKFARPYALELTDFDQGVNLENASVALLVLTLQFVRPLHRDALLASIYRGMNENGCLILVEKVLGESSTLNRLYIKYYYDFKRKNGYSALEISQKREALENVLIPYRLEENRELLKRTGFRTVDVFFKWFNFCGIVAVK
jgi:tRNA (cmo5U34)-methyltransferase